MVLENREFLWALLEKRSIEFGVHIFSSFHVRPAKNSLNSQNYGS